MRPLWGRPAIAFLVLGTSAAGAGCRTPATEELTSEAVVTVRAEAAVRGDIRSVVHASGVVTPSPGADLTVVAPDVARIAELRPGAGDRVRRGDVLVRFEIPALAADVHRQQSEVTRAVAALAGARSARTRASELFDRGIAAGREVEEATRSVADAEAAISQARAGLASAEALASRATVRAPFDGVVARRFHNPGDLVEATAADPVLRVIDPSRLEMVAAVPLADAARIAVGSAARVSGRTIGAGDFDAKVVAGPTTVDAGTATVPVRLAFAHAAALPAGALLPVDIYAERHANVLVIPLVAIVHEAEQATVFVAVGGKAQRRTVTVGLVDEARAEIISGVTAGELVIVNGHAGLPDQAAITVADTGETKPTDATQGGGTGGQQ